MGGWRLGGQVQGRGPGVGVRAVSAEPSHSRGGGRSYVHRRMRTDPDYGAMSTPLDRLITPKIVTGPASFVLFTYAALSVVAAVSGISSATMVPPTSST